jgi:hypothetical protein
VLLSECTASHEWQDGYGNYGASGFSTVKPSMRATSARARSETTNWSRSPCFERSIATASWRASSVRRRYEKRCRPINSAASVKRSARTAQTSISPARPGHPNHPAGHFLLRGRVSARARRDRAGLSARGNYRRAAGRQAGPARASLRRFGNPPAVEKISEDHFARRARSEGCHPAG